MQTLAIGDTRLGMPLDFSQSAAQFHVAVRWVNPGAVESRQRSKKMCSGIGAVLTHVRAAMLSGDVKFVVTAGAD